MQPVVLTGPADLAEVHAGLLVPAFPADELVDAEDLVAAVGAGTAEVLVLRDERGPVAAAVADFFPGAGVVLLSYLATRPDARAAGNGGRLLDAALERWRARADPCLVLAEVEDPAHHAGSTAHGDPAARLRFYGRRGARRLALPYVQPAVRPGAPRVPHLFLLVLHAAPELRRGEGAVDGRPVRAFLEAAFLADEGRAPTDPQALALLDAVGDETALLPV
ncbi:GNAT family N-acetyltransferase [Blastococcus sp. TF02A-35]|uniref:GNAT family N-acetyltransferase n=1 Tax=Blastococcus sp. TF02A-35 TaxID=2559612 RepID=UPI001073D86D|nr:GNAT family N-acetyltransferase [Blastococcus sp. TF02A_35]TFV48972.1 N-acetyltransferase [Blastococcus sp. TF02A_35]